MKKFFSLWLLTCMTLFAQAQILTPVKWTIKLDDPGTPEKAIVFTATAQAGWHLYDMNLPSGGPVSTSFTFETLTGAELIDQPTPSKQPVSVFDKQFEMQLRWYAGTVAFTQRFKVTDPAKFKMVGELEFMACNDQTCLPPDRIEFSFDKKRIRMDGVMPETVASSDSVAVIAATDSLVEDNGIVQTADLTGNTVLSNTTVPVTENLTDAADLWTPVVEELKSFGDSTVSAADNSWLYIFLAGFIGGLIALLTPCVWPMIPMTVSFFLKRTKSRKKAIRDAM